MYSQSFSLIYIPDIAISPNDLTFITGNNKKKKNVKKRNKKIIYKCARAHIGPVWYPFGEIFIGMIYCRHRMTPIIVFILISLITTTASKRQRRERSLIRWKSQCRNDLIKRITVFLSHSPLVARCLVFCCCLCCFFWVNDKLSYKDMMEMFSLIAIIYFFLGSSFLFAPSHSMINLSTCMHCRVCLCVSKKIS